jgi:3-dehydroquinate dehydratase/shikimate dehydrogenase
MLFASVANYDHLDTLPDGVDGIEFRLDLNSPPPPSVELPRLFTVRRESFGGTEKEREVFIRHLFTLKPDYFDLESDMDPIFLDWAFSQSINIILSYHNFDQTPQNLDSILKPMLNYPASIYKIATQANTTSDALRLLLFAKKHPKVSGIPMGERGSFGRVVGKIFGNPIQFGYLNELTAPGQLSIDELLKTYQFSSLNSQTAIFGLIGNPVVNSQGHIFHNQAFTNARLNAVYVKMQVEASELEVFFHLAKKLGFKGLSVTMPLKEIISPAIGPVNTVLLADPDTYFNFDGTAALDAIGSVNNKKMIIIGAGGTAASIAEEAIKRGANVSLLNRSLKRAENLANKLGCKWISEMADYDILINCTPSTAPIDAKSIIPESIVMDCVYIPPMTEFLQMAEKRGAVVISGEQMFLNQASMQADLWRRTLISDTIKP